MKKNHKLNDLSIAAIIPARGGSKRLKDKNIYPILGKPMINWVIEEITNSKYINNIYVTTENKKIMSTVKDYEIDVIERPRELSADNVEKMDAIEHALKKILENSKYSDPDIVISLQANSPSIDVSDLDNAIEYFYKNLYIRKPICEVISVGKNNLQNSCFRIMTRKTVFQKTLSTHVGIFFTDCHDVHTLEDVEVATRQITRRRANIEV